jgi:SulP family sulfate permease
VLAGLTVALVGLPQCLAYALLSGLPPAYGLSTAAAAGLVAALFGRSAQVVTGPTNTTGLLILAALTPYLAPNGLLDAGGLPVLATLAPRRGHPDVAALWAGPT